MDGNTEIQIDVLGPNIYGHIPSFFNVAKRKNAKYFLCLIFQDFMGALCNKNNDMEFYKHQNVYGQHHTALRAACLTELT